MANNDIYDQEQNEAEHVVELRIRHRDKDGIFVEPGLDENDDDNDTDIETQAPAYNWKYIQTVLPSIFFQEEIIDALEADYFHLETVLEKLHDIAIRLSRYSPDAKKKVVAYIYTTLGKIELQ